MGHVNSFWVQAHHFSPQLFVGYSTFDFFWSWDKPKNWFMIESNHKIDTLSRCPRKKVGGLKWWARTHKTFYAAQNVKIIFKNCGFLKNILRDFLFIQISKTDHFEWSKAIIELKKSWGSKMMGMDPQFFYATKSEKISFKNYGFLQNMLRDFWFLSKTQNSPFSRPIYYQIHLNID